MGADVRCSEWRLRRCSDLVAEAPLIGCVLLLHAAMHAAVHSAHGRGAPHAAGGALQPAGSESRWEGGRSGRRGGARTCTSVLLSHAERCERDPNGASARLRGNGTPARGAGAVLAGRTARVHTLAAVVREGQSAERRLPGREMNVEPSNAGTARVCGCCGWPLTCSKHSTGLDAGTGDVNASASTTRAHACWCVSWQPLGRRAAWFLCGAAYGSDSRPVVLDARWTAVICVCVRTCWG